MNMKISFSTALSIMIFFGMVALFNPNYVQAQDGITISTSATEIKTLQTIKIDVITDFVYTKSNKEVYFKTNIEAVNAVKFSPNPCILKFPTIGKGTCTVEFSSTKEGVVDIVASTSATLSNEIKIKVKNPTTTSNTTPNTASTTTTSGAGTTAAERPGDFVDAIPGKTGTNSSGGNFKLDVRINNPLKVDTIQDAMKLFMDAVLRIAIPFIVVFFIWSGLSFVLARGNPKKMETAKNMFLYTIIGTLLILGAWTITNAIIGTVNSITG